MANPYRIYLGNPTGMLYWWQDLVYAVRDLFLPVIEHTKYDAVSVHSTMTAPALRPTDLLVYVLPSASANVVATAFRTPSGVGGTTAWNSEKGTGSEVYTYNSDPDNVANLIFHEALHNKLHWDDARLHAQGGLAGSPVHPPETKSDIALMRQGIAMTRPQWMGGWAAVNDPLRGL
ncbi:MAG TPA: hypothetical protein VFK05_31210 [Polyangiaceae bacterium]|nr:hypothetical protein [Polyangiaceae bacterium]